MRRIANAWVMTFALIACGDDIDALDGSAVDASADGALLDTSTRDTATGDTGEVLDGRSQPDSPGADSPADSAGPDAGPVNAPDSIAGELVYRATTRLQTPPTWNSHIPKLVSDGVYLYAIAHHSPAGSTSERQTHILRRALSGGEWTSAATMRGLHQPPAASFDSESRLHLAFDCLYDAGTVQNCFQGGVNSAGIRSRAYHLVFAARSADEALRFDAYSNTNEWTLVSDGYHGIGSNAAGRTVWSFLNGEGGRIIQTTTVDSTGTYPPVERAGTTFLYPIHLPLDGASVLSFAADFDASGGTNAGYPSSSLLLTTNAGTENLLTLRPDPAVEAGAAGAFPTDLDVEADGTVLALAYRIDAAANTCTELLRFDDGLRMPPVVLPVGCVSNYAKLQIASDGQLFIITGNGTRSIRLGQSSDRGASWTWYTIALDVPTAMEDYFIAPTPIEARTSVTGFDPDVIRFVYSGRTNAGSDALYYSELTLAPWLSEL